MNKILIIIRGLSAPLFTLVIVVLILLAIAIATSAALLVGSVLTPPPKPTTTLIIPSNVFCDKDGLFYIKNGNITSPVWNTNAQRQYICVDTDTQIIVK